MIKYVYSEVEGYRVKVKTDTYFNQLELQPQKKWWIFWFNISKWMVVEEETTDHSINDLVRGMNPRQNYYNYGNVHEIWRKGTLDIRRRAEQMIDEYFKEKFEREKFLSETKHKIESL